MPQSMTGYGRGECSENNREFIVEIKTVNHRYCDMFVKLPRNIIGLEDNVRKTISANIARGKVDLFITYNDRSQGSKKLEVDYALADSYRALLKDLSERYSVKDNTNPDMILRFPDVLLVEKADGDLDEIWNVLRKALIQALENLTSMRKKEGENLKTDLIGRKDKILDLLLSIEKRAPIVVLEYKEKLENRLTELLDKNDMIDGQRLAQEVAIYADKCAIDEEIVRLKSHMAQLNDILKMDESIGRKLDFLVQEMNREANTIGSKSNDIEITQNMLEIKSEIEKIREQVQNIE